MNVNSIINMAIKMVTRKIMSRGIDAGMNMATKKRSGAQYDEENLSKGERAQLQQGKENSKRAKKSMKAARKIGKF